jgi:TrmH family RNA methyltransferase
MTPVSKAQIKLVQSLHQKKFRQMYGKFLVEGDKAVRELLHSSFKIDAIYALPDWIAAHSSAHDVMHPVTAHELQQLSTHDHPDQAIAVAFIPDQESLAVLDPALYIACDHVNDPGNAGTIIRIADWFGIPTVIFSAGSVDVYNPKVVSAAKGSLFRIRIIHTDLKTLFNKNINLPVIGAAMDGENIYQTKLPTAGILLIGNEANGISDDLYPSVSKRVTIPSFGQAESLNAGVATGIIVSEWKRQLLVNIE